MDCPATPARLVSICAILGNAEKGPIANTLYGANNATTHRLGQPNERNYLKCGSFSSVCPEIGVFNWIFVNTRRARARIGVHTCVCAPPANREPSKEPSQKRKKTRTSRSVGLSRKRRAVHARCLFVECVRKAELAMGLSSTALQRRYAVIAAIGIPVSG